MKLSCNLSQHWEGELFIQFGLILWKENCPVILANIGKGIFIGILANIERMKLSSDFGQHWEGEIIMRFGPTLGRWNFLRFGWTLGRWHCQVIWANIRKVKLSSNLGQDWEDEIGMRFAPKLGRWNCYLIGKLTLLCDFGQHWGGDIFIWVNIMKGKLSSGFGRGNL